MKRLAVALGFVAAASLCGCARDAGRVGDQFIDRYFVETDQARARPLTVGLAQKKLDDELHLVESVRKNIDEAQQRPTVFWKRREVRESGEQARVTYDLTIRYGHDETHKNAMLSMEHEADGWRVANFLVADGALPQR